MIMGEDIEIRDVDGNLVRVPLYLRSPRSAAAFRKARSALVRNPEQSDA
jgi:hypothetical protein